MNIARTDSHAQVGEFKILATDGAARCAQLQLPHGSVLTPIFMPVGTYGSVKAMSPKELINVEAQIILGNTYHLWLRPGMEVIEEHGGLHKFMGWTRPILTDSGGFQVFSLGKLRKISEEGVRFRSPIDGSARLLTPEVAAQVQHKLNSDIQMVLDECTPYPATLTQAQTSLELTLRWAARARETHQRLGCKNLQFGIQQGGVHQSLREKSIASLVDMGFEGYALGGLAVGEPEEMRQTILANNVALLPSARPRYLMGVGTPLDLIHAVKMGVDMFDCVLPTRNGRNGWLYTACGIIKIRNAKFRHDLRAIEKNCECYTCANFTRAYLHHLQQCNEPLSAQLSTLHNLHFYLKLMADMRAAIHHGQFSQWSDVFAQGWKNGEENNDDDAEADSLSTTLKS